jgi:hypothetical protein
MTSESAINQSSLTDQETTRWDKTLPSNQAYKVLPKAGCKLSTEDLRVWAVVLKPGLVRNQLYEATVFATSLTSRRDLEQDQHQRHRIRHANRNQRCMYELKRNMTSTNAMRPSLLNQPKDQEQRGCSSRVNTPDRLVASQSPTSRNSKPGPSNITLGRCLCSAAIHQEMEGEPGQLNPQTKSEDDERVTPVICTSLINEVSYSRRPVVRSG